LKHIYQNIFGYFDFEDIYKTAVVMAPSTAHFVEVGAFWGKSTAFLAVEVANSHKTIKIDAVDKWGNIPESGWDSLSYDQDPEQRKEAARIIREFKGSMKGVFDHNMKLHELEKFVNPIQGESVKVAERYADGSLDFVFIDANHSFGEVKMDIEAWFPKVKKSGILAGHDFDIDTPGVAKAVASTLGGFNRILDNGMVLVYKGSWIACPAGTHRLVEFLIQRENLGDRW